MLLVIELHSPRFLCPLRLVAFLLSLGIALAASGKETCKRKSLHNLIARLIVLHSYMVCYLQQAPTVALSIVLQWSVSPAF